jgi:hypothetical protein
MLKCLPIFLLALMLSAFGCERNIGDTKAVKELPKSQQEVVIADKTPVKPAIQTEPEVKKSIPVQLPVAKKEAKRKELVILDFDSGDKPNNIGGDFGAWDKDPNDTSQTCEGEFIFGDDAMGNPDGYSYKLKYDVDSRSPAYNGFWTKLEGEDFSMYNILNIYLKGDVEAGFTTRIKLELKDFGNSSPLMVSGITEKWQKFSFPFSKFRRVKDWTSMNEFVIVFDDVNSSPKVGAILFDQVTVSKENDI